MNTSTILVEGSLQSISQMLITPNEMRRDVVTKCALRIVNDKRWRYHINPQNCCTGKTHRLDNIDRDVLHSLVDTVDTSRLFDRVEGKAWKRLCRQIVNEAKKEARETKKSGMCVRL